MGKTAKSAKKFVKKHLKSTIIRRRGLKPIKNSFKRKQASFSAGGSQADGKIDAAAGDKLSAKNIKDMSADEFLDGSFLSDGSDDNSCILSEDDNGDFDERVLVKDLKEDLTDITLNDVQKDDLDDEGGGEHSSLHSQNKSLYSEVDKHKRQLEKLKEKDPKFFKFLEDHDKGLLEFSDEEMGTEDTAETRVVPTDARIDLEASSSRLTTSLVEAWCKVIKEKHHIGTICNLLKAYRTACHYGDEEEAFENKYTIASSHVFNKVMFFTLSEMDNEFRRILGIDTKEGFIFEPEKFSRWKKLEPLVKSYFGNTLHILTQMTDNQMISFTLKRLKASTCFLGALPRFARKYLKVALHFWGRGEGSVTLISFLFVREMALVMGTDQLDACLKGIYKEFTTNSKFVTASALPRIRFMINCVAELYGIDLAASYQQAFVFIRQLAIILRNALTMKTKDSYKHVYSWQFINSLELWVQVLTTHSDKKELQPLVYPLTQIMSGVAHLVPTTRYFPLRMHCIQLLTRLAAATGMFIPVSSLLLDMLEFKELNKAPTGVGKSIDFGCTLKISKPNLKTRAFQDECIAAIVEQMSEHLGQWSYSVAFPELALVPLLGLRRFVKGTKVDRFRRQVKQLIEHIEQNIKYVGRKRDGVSFSPKDSQLVSSFLQEEKLAGLSPLSKFGAILRQSAEQRRSNLHTSSVVVKEEHGRESGRNESSSHDEDKVDVEGINAFCSDWLPPKKQQRIVAEGKAKSVRTRLADAEVTGDDSDAEDVVEELELSSDENVIDAGVESSDSSDEEKTAQARPKRSKQKASMENRNAKKELKGSVRKNVSRDKKGKGRQMANGKQRYSRK